MAHAEPIHFSIGNCVHGDCSAFDVSGRGAIEVSLDVVNGNDLLLTLENTLNADGTNDDPFVAHIGFEYGTLLTGLSFDGFTVLSGNVASGTFTIDTTIRPFHVDFGFSFSQAGSASRRDGRFQAMDSNEMVQILIGTSGEINLDDFRRGVAKVGGVGDNGRGAIVLTGVRAETVPEPGSLVLILLGAGMMGMRRSVRTT